MKVKMTKEEMFDFIVSHKATVKYPSPTKWIKGYSKGESFISDVSMSSDGWAWPENETL